MKRTELLFERPEGLEATEPTEAHGGRRDDVRLLVSAPDGHTHARFRDLPPFLEPGDLLVVNDSATLAASIPASGTPGPFRVNVSTRFGPRLWLAEPRWGPNAPAPFHFRAETASTRARATSSS